MELCIICNIELWPAININQFLKYIKPGGESYIRYLRYIIRNWTWFEYAILESLFFSPFCCWEVKDIQSWVAHIKEYELCSYFLSLENMLIWLEVFIKLMTHIMAHIMVFLLNFRHISLLVVECNMSKSGLGSYICTAASSND